MSETDWDERLRRRQSECNRVLASLVKKHGVDGVQEALSCFGWYDRFAVDEHDPLSNYRLPGRTPKKGGRGKKYSLQMLMDVECHVRLGAQRTSKSVNAFCKAHPITWLRGGDLAVICVARGATLRRLYYRAVALMNEQRHAFSVLAGRPPSDDLGSTIRTPHKTEWVSEADHVNQLGAFWRNASAACQARAS